MIILDTTVLIYSVGAEHPMRDPCRHLVGVAGAGQAEVTTTVEVVQELVHARARRRSREDAVRWGRHFATLLAPLLRPTAQDLTHGLEIFEAHSALGAFDAVLAATAIALGCDALVSADRAFDGIPGLIYLAPDSPGLAQLLDE